jgi:hypothetical protein
MLTFLPFPAPPLPAGLSDVRNAIQTYAHDHTDRAEYERVLALIAECRAAVLELAPRVSRTSALLNVADMLDDAASPLSDEAMRWDDEREDRQHRNAMDRSRVWRPCDLPNAAE